MAFSDNSGVAMVIEETVTGLSDKVVILEEGKDPLLENERMNELVAMVKEKFNRSKVRRYQDEMRWLRCYTNHRGIYASDTQFTSTEKSRVFVKVTKNKVLASYAQIVDVLFAGNKFPIGIESPNYNTGDLPDAVNFDANPQAAAQPTAAPPPKSATIARPELLDIFIGAASKLGEKLKIGVGKSPTEQTFEPAKMAAKKLEKLIHDQLAESDADKALRYLALEMSLLGTGIFKGPFAVDKEFPMWTDTGEYQPKTETIPRCSAVSVWNAYPDADAKNMDECDYFIERHKLSRFQLRDLKKRKHFRSDSIDEAILRGPNYVAEYWENQLEDFQTTVDIDRFEVIEFWGMMDKETAKEAGLDIPSELKEAEEFQINAWICQDQILRLVLNPFTPARIPYYAVPYELNPYSFFGIGVAENMFDSQLIMNGAWRLAIDNAALSGNLLIELDETNLVPGQSLEIFPGKVFRRQAGAPGQAIFGTKFPNVTQENLILYDKARQLADEATSMPSYAHGGTNVGGMGRTASGMSMLMGAADKTVKAVVKNIDDYLLTPLGKSYFAFNMQFNFDKDFIGDLTVVARGTESLMRNEVRSQRLLQFLQVGSGNPLTAPLVKADYILRELATSLDLDEDLILNDPRAAAAQAALIAMQQPQGQGQAQQGGVPSPDDPTGSGGGNIGPGNAPLPGQPGFAGNTAGQGNTGNIASADSARAETATV